MKLQFLGQSFSRSAAAIATQTVARKGHYRGQEAELTPEAINLPEPNKTMTYRGSSYLGR